MGTMYFCWLCQLPIVRRLWSETHYETGERIFFCSLDHKREYMELKAL